MRLNTESIASDLRRHPAEVLPKLVEAMEWHRDRKPGGINPNELSLKHLAEGLVTTHDGTPCGREWVNSLDPRNGGISFQEAIAGVSTTQFANITGQLIFSSIMQGFQQEEFVASRMVATVPTKFTKGEKIPGISRIQDPGQDVLIVEENMPYKSYGFGEEFVQAPATVKRGLIVPVSKEAIFDDRTSLVTVRANEVGMIMGLNKEKRLLDMIIGATNTYQEFRRGMSSVTARTTYSTELVGGGWVNHLDNNGLVDWSDIDDAENLFAEMVDPSTGEPIIMSGKTLFVPQQKRATANRIISATEVRETSNTNTQTNGGNPLQGLGISVQSSRQLYARLTATDGLGQTATDAKGYWFYGDFNGAFAYYENWPITTAQETENSAAAFDHDIVMRFKASERGAATVTEPRKVIRSRTLAVSSSSGA